MKLTLITAVALTALFSSFLWQVAQAQDRSRPKLKMASQGRSCERAPAVCALLRP